jgi:Domain of unknown function (DUF4402)
MNLESVGILKMNALLRMTSLAALAATAFVATPALAIGPSNGNATATARIVKPLTLVSKQNLDLGTILLSGAGTWSGANVAISRGGTFSCTNTNVTCSGTTQVAKYTVTGTNNQTVTITAGNVTLKNANDLTKTLLLTVDNPGTVLLGNSGSTGVDFSLGGAITVDSTTVDGVYNGTFDVTVDY